MRASKRTRLPARSPRTSVMKIVEAGLVKDHLSLTALAVDILCLAIFVQIKYNYDKHSGKVETSCSTLRER
ncbi:MAG: hypothetical protein QXU72_07800 [Thermofilum sp.]